MAIHVVSHQPTTDYCYESLSENICKLLYMFIMIEDQSLKHNIKYLELLCYWIIVNIVFICEEIYSILPQTGSKYSQTKNWKTAKDKNNDIFHTTFLTPTKRFKKEIWLQHIDMISSSIIFYHLHQQKEIQANIHSNSITILKYWSLVLSKSGQFEIETIVILRFISKVLVCFKNQTLIICTTTKQKVVSSLFKKSIPSFIIKMCNIMVCIVPQMWPLRWTNNKHQHLMWALIILICW